MLSVDDADNNAEQLFWQNNSLSIKGPAPAQVVGRVARRYATKALQPSLETLMVSVDVLHVDSKIAQSSRTHTGAQADRLVHDPVLACEGAVGGMAVTEQQRLRIEPGQ